MSRRIPWFEILLILLVMSISLYAALSDGQNLSWRWFVRDDAYYYFKVAQNISEGHGSTFDGINKTNGYHPLWMLICIPIFALARFDLILPLRILLLVMSALSVATGILLYRLIGRIFIPAIGAIAALFWTLSYDVLDIVYKQGLETGIAAFFIVLLAYKLYEFEISWRKNASTNRQIAVLALIAVLAMLSRLDLVFLAGLAGIWVVFRGSLLRYYLPLDIATIIAVSVLSYLIRISMELYYDYVDVVLVFVGLSLVIKIAGAFLFGLYQREILSKPFVLLNRLVLFALTTSTLLGILMLGALRLNLVQGSFSQMSLLIDFGLTFLVFAINRFMFTALKTQSTLETEVERPISFLKRNWRRWFSDAAIFYGIVLGALAIYMLWSELTFGTASPVSGQIKRWWAALPGSTYGGATNEILSFFGIAYYGDANAWNPVSRLIGHWAENFRLWGLIDRWRYFLLLVLFALVFYLIFFIQRRKAKTSLTQLGIVPLFFSSWLQVLYYHAIGYSAYKDWYWITQLVVVVLTLSFMAGMIYTLLRKIPHVQVFVWILAAYVGFHYANSYWRNVQASMQYNVWLPDDPYMDIVPILEANTEPGSIIGMTGGGNPGYFIHDRTVVNMDGLINSNAYFESLQGLEAGAFLNELGMDYVLANPSILRHQPYNGQFDEYMEETDIRYGGKQLLRYGKP